MIKYGESKLHWNYFLALEKDVEVLSRYIEFCDDNRSVFSIELAHLLFAASSEVDVVCKAFCKMAATKSPRNNIDDYRKVILKTLPEFPHTKVTVSRFGMTLTPWENWGNGVSPDWWQSHNKVKHERDKHFNQATLQNTLNAMAGLLVITFEYYHFLRPQGFTLNGPWKTISLLRPGTTLFKMPNWFFFGREEIY